ncbi:hypothetical protein EV356DRAFT_218846 [Viridothelium virens]|uniref:Uncharacterized protein n=1 Tax=Viridothelium virens TaxID=1048519 RepID=A0A6A6HML7_VIRVR|nr:hypothetical protein EV356DRAFT_218846 [Viridothelium virens]
MDSLELWLPVFKSRMEQRGRRRPSAKATGRPMLDLNWDGPDCLKVATGVKFTVAGSAPTRVVFWLCGVVEGSRQS